MTLPLYQAEQLGQPRNPVDRIAVQNGVSTNLGFPVLPIIGGVLEAGQQYLSIKGKEQEAKIAAQQARIAEAQKKAEITRILIVGGGILLIILLLIYWTRGK